MSKDKSEKKDKDKDKSEKALAAEKEQFVKNQVNMLSCQGILLTVYYLALIYNPFNSAFSFTAAEHFEMHNLHRGSNKVEIWPQYLLEY